MARTKVAPNRLGYRPAVETVDVYGQPASNTEDIHVAHTAAVA